MPITMNEKVIMGDDGKFTSDFNPGMLGDEYKDSKFFGETPDLMSLMKRAVDAKSALGKKLEGHIPPLGEDPTEEEKTAHRKSLMAGLGTIVENVADYGLVKPSDWPENTPYDEETSKHFASFLFERGWPKEAVQELVTEYDKVALARFQAFVEAQNTAYDGDIKELKSDWKGPALIKKTRTAAKAMIQFGTDELIVAVKESGLVTTPDDFDKWKALDISAAQIRVWCNIGEKMKSDKAIADEGTLEAERKTTQKAKQSQIYDHATSANMT